VHDAARPIVPESLIDRVLAPLADGADAVVPTMPVTDTIKRIDAQGKIVETIDRSLLGAAQTPQACRASALHAALDGLDDAALAAITDDSAAIEARGGKAFVVIGDQRTRKVTTPDDLAALELVLAPPAPAAVDEDPTPDDEYPEDLEPLDEDDLAGAGDEEGVAS
jgi:2-C-methyl-D-erythritol 4-phosphate cytidylyltransferase/2-C-methyl-D-erythritol 2,4-cyclodiphosphate synthase